MVEASVYWIISTLGLASASMFAIAIVQSGSRLHYTDLEFLPDEMLAEQEGSRTALGIEDEVVHRSARIREHADG